MQNLIFRKATLDDAAAVADILCRSWVAAYTGLIPDDIIAEKNAQRPAQSRSRLAGEHNICVAVLNGSVIGAGVFEQTDDTDLAGYFEIRVFYIDPDYFRQGFGRQFMRFALGLAHAGNCPGALLYVLEGNANARHFYGACGFAPDGARKVQNVPPLENIRYVMKF